MGIRVLIVYPSSTDFTDVCAVPICFVHRFAFIEVISGLCELASGASGHNLKVAVLLLAFFYLSNINPLPYTEFLTLTPYLEI
jgi:hypothetical protein